MTTQKKPIRKPRFKPRVCYVDGDKGRTLWNGKRTGTGAGLFYPRRVRVTDARDLTPEKAVEKVIQGTLNRHGMWAFNDSLYEEMAKDAGMVATITRKYVGRNMARIVRVRSAKE